MGDQVFVRWTVIENFDVLRGLDEDFRMGRGKGGGAEQAPKQNESRDQARDSCENSFCQWFLVARTSIAANSHILHQLLHTPLAQRNEEVRLQSH